VISNGRLRYLRIVLVVAGLACIALYPLMIVGIYAILGVFLLLAAGNRLANLRLIWITVWSSVVHGGIMTIQSLTTPGQMGQFTSDVPALFAAAIALAILASRGDTAQRAA
jgi:uncharacterized membrane protein